MLEGLVGISQEVFHLCAPNVIFCDDGATMKMGGIRVGFVGGAVSVDKGHRRAYIDWFPEEVISDRKLDRILKNMKPCQVLFTHDGPSDIDINKLCGSSKFKISQKLEQESLTHRYKIKQISDMVKPQLHIHGHYHNHYVENKEYRKVVGLANDGRPNSMMILDLETLQFTMH